MNNDNPVDYDQDRIKQAHDYLIDLAKLNVKFADVIRAPRYPSGRRESDVEHSYHLAMSATEMAANYYPELDTGLVSQFSLVHDLAEFYCGDVWTLGISDEERSKKEQAEKLAIERLLTELPPHTAELLHRYESQQEPEARFVRFVDKLLPDIIHLIAGDVRTYQQDHGVMSLDDLNALDTDNSVRLQKLFPEFQFIHDVRSMIMETFKQELFSDTPKFN